MPTYAALLRAINLGAVRQVKMPHLKGVLTGLGFGDVATYLQSGNAVFTSAREDRGGLRALLESTFEKEFGFEVPTLIRAAQELAAVVAGCPYRVQANADPTRVHATFFDPSPPPEVWAGIDAFSVAPEEFVVAEGVVYMHLPDGIGRARLQGMVDRATRNVTATNRNWRTVLALEQMARQST